MDLRAYKVREHLNEPLSVEELRKAGATPKQIKGIMRVRGKALRPQIKARKELLRKVEEKTQQFMDQGVSD